MAGIIKRKIIRPVRDTLLYYFFLSIISIHHIVPRKPILWWHGLIAKCVYYFFPNTRKNITKHLTLALGKEKSAYEILLMGKELFVILSKTFTDYILFSHYTKRTQFQKYFTIEGEEYLRSAYEKGKGVLCLIPHTPGWEFSAIMPPILGYNTSAVSREIRNPALNKLLVGYREARGMKNIPRDHCYDKLIKALSNGECLVIMIDQDSMTMKGEFLTFFGKPAYTPLGCARLAMDSGAAIIPMATYRKKDDTYLFKILPEVPLIHTGDEHQDIITNTQIHNDIIEKLIRLYPTQWVWMHKRWATTPKLLKEYLKKKRDEKAKYKQQEKHNKT